MTDFLAHPLVFLACGAMLAGMVMGFSSRHNVLNAKKGSSKQGSAGQRLMPYIRRIVFCSALAVAVGIYYYAASRYDTAAQSIMYMARLYGLAGIFMLFATLSLGLIRGYFPHFRFNDLLLRSSRGFGLSAFLFVSLHVIAAFTANLGGRLDAITFLSGRHQLALVFSVLAFIVLLLMAATSIDRVIAWMTFPRWKKLHRFVYIAALLAVFHAFLIGSHFADVAAPLPLIVFLLAYILILLESGATYRKLQINKQKHSPVRLRVYSIGLGAMVLLAGVLSIYGLGSAYDPHAAHRGDYILDYSMDVRIKPEQLTLHRSTELLLTVTDKRSDRRVQDFTILDEELMHLIIISEDMNYYYHLHPDYIGNGEFVSSFTPHVGGDFFMYATFAPKPGQEALVTAIIDSPLQVPYEYEITPTERTRHAGSYTVELDAPAELATGEIYDFTYTITDRNTGEAITEIEPYLGAFGHLAAISEDKLSYLHVHPTEAARSSSDRGGPELGFAVAFPKSGKYKMYLQFQHKGMMQFVDFVVEVR